MQKLGVLANWSELQPKEFLEVPVTAARRARLRVNGAVSTAMYYYPVKKDGKVDQSSDPIFLARVNGLDEIEFKLSSPIAIVVDEPILVDTNVGLTIEPREASESFTRIVERKAVSPEMAAVLARANARDRQFTQAMQSLVGEVQKLKQQKVSTNGNQHDASAASGRADDAANGKSQTGDAGLSSAKAEGTGEKGDDAKSDDSGQVQSSPSSDGAA